MNDITAIPPVRISRIKLNRQLKLIGLKYCPICEENKSIKLDFTIRKNRNNNIVAAGYCRLCNAERMREMRETFPDKYIEQAKNRRNILDQMAERICTSCKTLYKSDYFHKGANSCIACVSYRVAIRTDKKKQRKTCNKEYFINILKIQLCYYCDYIGRVSVDRIDNNKGHEEGNLVPACLDCQFTRQDRWSCAEMKNEIGPVIRKIREQRILQGK